MKKLSTIFLISIFVLGASLMVFNNLSYANEEEWQTVGGPSISGGRAWSPSLAFDSNNIPYVAYQESGSAKATVKKFNGNTWETVGSAGFSAGAISVGHSSLQIGSDNVPYFAYTDYNSAQSDNVPYFAYTDDNNAKKVTVKKFNGVAWQTVGNAGFSSDITNGGQTNYISLAISNNIPYVVYVNDAPGGNDDDDTASVMKFNGNSWEFVGGDNFHSKGISWTFLAIDSNGIPYVAFTDTDNNYEIAVMKFICNKDIWSCSEWSTCTINGTQTRSCSMTFDCISASTPSPATTQPCIYIPPCTLDNWSCTNWSSCSSSGTQTRTCNKISNCQGGVSSPATSQSCTYIPPTCTSWTYSNWGACSSTGQQTRTVTSSSPSGCSGGSPVLSQNCNYISIPTPKITSISPNPAYEGDKITILGENFEDCAPDVRTDSKILIGGVEKNFRTGDSKWGNKQITYTTNFGQGSGKLKIVNCDKLSSNEVDLVVTKRNPVLISLEPNKVYETFGYSTGPWQYITVYGTDFGNTDPGSNYQFYLNGQYLDRGNISSWTNNSFKLHVPYYLGKYDVYWGGEIKVTPGDYELQIQLGKINNTWVYSNKITLTVLASCTQDKWSCGEWGECLANGKKQRTCTKTFDCPTIETVSPATTQSCTYTPPCQRDIWECDSWDQCSPSGTQTRSCRKTYDCSLAEDATPTTSKFCEASTKPNNDVEGNIDREQIIKSTVKLVCQDAQKPGWAKLGSGTIIDQYGTILTNRHVILGTVGACKVGFITNEDDIPSFIEMADAKKISTDSTSNGDMAILKIRNIGNKKYTAVDILQGNSDNLKSGDTILPFGYPNEDLFGGTITFTEGPYAGKGTTVTFTKENCREVKGNSETYNVSSFFKTTATVDHGNSGGGAYQKKSGYFVGIPTLGTSCDPNIPSRINYILSVNAIKRWLNSLSGNYSPAKNNFSILKNYYSQSANIQDIDLATIKIADSSDNINSLDKDNSNKPNSSTNQAPVDAKLKGYILLQVESHGEAWYVNPADGKRYYMKDGATAYQMMRNFGLGITNANLTKVPQEGEKNNYPSFVNSLKGKILIQTELHGEAWYVNPKTGYRHYMKDGEAAYNLMRYYSTGITNKDLERIPEGNL